MTGLEKILEEIKETAIFMQTTSGYGAMCVSTEAVEHIIRKHMNDGWIPVKEYAPEDGQEVLCCDDRAVYLVEYQADWDAPFGDLDGITAWRPLSKPYRPERSKE